MVAIAALLRMVNEKERPLRGEGSPRQIARPEPGLVQNPGGGARRCMSLVTVVGC